MVPATNTTKSAVKECKLVYSVDEFVALCSHWDGQANVYVGLNELRGDYQQQKGHRTSKTDIAAVHFVTVDIDSVRPKNEAATADELVYALDAAESLSKLWFPKHGFLSPVMAMSGNGCQMWLKITRYDLTNESKHGNEFEWELRLKGFYNEPRAAIPNQYADKVEVDSIGDVTRIFKVIGTTSVKGKNTIERPHRESYWINSLDDEVDKALLDYILSLPISRPAKVSVPQSGKKPQVQVGGALPNLSAGQKEVLNMALRAPYVKMVRDRLNPSDMSNSDWAFLKELSKEGIYHPDVLTHALMTTKDTKFYRDGKGGYLTRTIDNFVSQLSGISLMDGRKQLEKEFDKLSRKNTGVVVCGAAVGLGKTYCAKKVVSEAVDTGMNVLVLTPEKIV